jgi:hypothetical protein
MVRRVWFGGLRETLDRRRGENGSRRSRDLDLVSLEHVIAVDEAIEHRVGLARTRPARAAVPSPSVRQSGASRSNTVCTHRLPYRLPMVRRAGTLPARRQRGSRM